MNRARASSHAGVRGCESERALCGPSERVGALPQRQPLVRHAAPLVNHLLEGARRAIACESGVHAAQLAAVRRDRVVQVGRLLLIPQLLSLALRPLRKRGEGLRNVATRLVQGAEGELGQTTNEARVGADQLLRLLQVTIHLRGRRRIGAP